MTESPSSFPAPIVCCGTGSGANFVFDASLFCRGITDYILDSIEVTLLKFLVSNNFGFLNADKLQSNARVRNRTALPKGQ